MTKEALDRIQRIIEDLWSGSGVWPDYLNLLHQALHSGRSSNSGPDKNPSRWLLLPGWCCQAAGGDPMWGDNLAAAWLLFYDAAHLMDHVEDQDAPDAWWADLGAGAAINVATGLYFGASRALQQLSTDEITHNMAVEIIGDFSHSFLTMCSGQHRDLVNRELTLEQYWQIAEAKSGGFFALACRSGARLATDDGSQLDCYTQFGRHLGLLIQILDDLEELRSTQDLSTAIPWPKLGRSLPVVYALEVCPTEMCTRLRDSMRAAPEDSQAAKEARDLIDQSGAALYLITEIERHRTQAVNALEKANPRSPAREQLISSIQDIGSI